MRTEGKLPDVEVSGSPEPDRGPGKCVALPKAESRNPKGLLNNQQLGALCARPLSALSLWQTVRFYCGVLACDILCLLPCPSSDQTDLRGAESLQEDVCSVSPYWFAGLPLRPLRLPGTPALLTHHAPLAVLVRRHIDGFGSFIPLWAERTWL